MCRCGVRPASVPRPLISDGRQTVFRPKIISGGKNHTAVGNCFGKRQFFFRELTGGSEEDPVRRCTGIVVDPAVSGELGDPDPNGMLDSAEIPGEQAEAQRLNELADTVALNSMMFRNLMVGFMVLDPGLETNVPGKEAWTVLLDILDVLNGENPGFVLNDIHYCSNENGELVIEPTE